jgi:hypothetical protein
VEPRNEGSFDRIRLFESRRALNGKLNVEWLPSSGGFHRSSGSGTNATHEGVELEMELHDSNPKLFEIMLRFIYTNGRDKRERGLRMTRRRSCWFLCSSLLSGK